MPVPATPTSRPNAALSDLPDSLAARLSRPLNIGTRGSELAIAQSQTTVATLRAALPDLPAPDILPIRTTGDRVTDRPLADVGGKGLFAKEIETALLTGQVDIAVHSLKDLETTLPEGLTIAAVLPRGDPRDALVAVDALRLDQLKPGARVGTSSIRRTAQLLSRRPDIDVVAVRGNVNTRLARLEAGAADALLLSVAGLERLNIPGSRYAPVPPEEMLPAAGQGVIAIQCREDDTELRAWLESLGHSPSTYAMTAERALLAALDGSCRTPIGGFAETTDDRLRLRAMVLSPDGRQVYDTERDGPVADAASLGTDAGEELRRSAPAEIFQDW